jgi:hypothetical protein
MLESEVEKTMDSKEFFKKLQAALQKSKTTLCWMLF